MKWENFKQQKLKSFEEAKEEELVDEEIIPLLNVINSKKEFVTTSSCYGRVVILYYDTEKGKKNSNFIKKWHREITKEELEETLNSLGSRKSIWFKVEPFILHIAVKNIESAKNFLALIKKSGIKRGGIQSITKKIMIETQGHGQIIIPLEHTKLELEGLVETANKMMKKNEETLKRLKRIFKY